jgi:Zinc finger, C2H2 type
MYSNQQSHSSGGNYQPHQNPSSHSSFGAASLRHPTSYPRSSSVSSAAGYRQATSPDFDNANVQQHPAYYPSDVQHQYTSSPQTPNAPIPPYQLPGQRSAGDNSNYATGQHTLDGTSAFRRAVQPMHSGPSRARTMSLSYAQPGISSRSSSMEYNQQKYSHDSRFAPPQQTHLYPPPSSYRAGAGSPPPLVSHAGSRAAPIRMNSSPLSHTEARPRQPPLTSQPPAHPISRRGSSASTSSQSYQPRAVPIEPATGHTKNSASASATQPRPHVCELCGLAFVRGHDLKRHKDTHTNSKPHVCDCGKSFSRKDALKRHVHLKSCRGEKIGSGYATSEE